MEICLIITYLLNIIDYLFTLYWVRKFGIEIEGNPIGKWMFKKKLTWLFKIVVVGILLGLLAVYIYFNPAAIWIAYIPLVVYIGIIIYHVGILLKILSKKY